MADKTGGLITFAEREITDILRRLEIATNAVANIDATYFDDDQRLPHVLVELNTAREALTCAVRVLKVVASSA